MKNDIKYEINKINQEVGVTIKNPRDILPPVAFTYGKPIKKTENGVSQVLREWKEHNPSKAQKRMKNYNDINKSLIRSTLPPSLSRNIIQESLSKNTIMKDNQSAKEIQGRYDNTQPCGIKSGKQVPIKGIINNDYGNESEKALKEYYDAYFKKLDRKQRNSTIDSSNRVILKRSHKDPKPKLDSIRNQIERVRVFTKLDLPQMEKYDHIQSIVSKEITKFKTYKSKPGIKSI